MKNYYLPLLFLSCCFYVSAQGITFTASTFGGSSNICCVADMNNDKLDDIVVVSAAQMTIYKQKSAGGYDPVVITLANSVSVANWSIAAGDFDKNGYNDIVLGNGSRVTVLKANEDGTDYSIIAYPENIFTQRTNFVDIDNDGNLDLWACHDVDQSHPYRNDGAGNLLLDYTLFPTSNEGGNYATIWIDYDNDGDIDMYEAKCRGGADVNDPKRINLLYKNNGDGTFTNVAPEAGVDDHAQSWSTAVEDFDNDGDLDFLLSNISDTNKFFRNNGDGTFTDIYATTGIAPQVGSWELQAADFNNDGWVDFFWQNGKELYINNGDLTFTGYDLPFSEGAIGDLNNDGFLDVQIGSNVYYNSGNANKWFNVQLEGIDSNRNGIGARVEIYGAWGKQIREIRSGQGFSHMSSLKANFGLGSSSSIDKVVIKWPSGIEDTIFDPTPNQNLVVVEGSTLLTTTENSSSYFSIYPNPTNDILNVKLNTTDLIENATIYDLSGRHIMNSDLVNQTIDVKSLSTGSYLLLLKDKKGNSYSQKFVRK
jgi:ASPIC and UnbV/FG-GAP-like repeat/Secretion system C-terminal sorting domain